MLPRLLPKQWELELDQFENSALEGMPVGYEMRLYVTEVDVSVVFKRNSRLAPAVPDSNLGPARPRWFLFSAMLLSTERTGNLSSSQLSR